MSPKLPVHNSQTITEFLNLHQNHISEEDSDESYKFAFDDEAFLARRETMGIRFELELLKPEVLLKEHGIEHTITVFGSTRFISHEQALQLERSAKTSEEVAVAKKAVLHSSYYESAREFGALVAHYNATQKQDSNKLHICTGGGPGIMEAANKYITPGLSFRFHYFALRKMHFMLRARAIVAYPGGFGSFDELFEVLTLIQTKKVVPIPVILVGKDYWSEMVNFKQMVEFGVIDQEDMQSIHFSETAQDAWRVITDWYQLG
jgi:predicted Rossmann-fold nucleotide-binding protein